MAASEETQRVLEKIDSDSVEKMVDILVETNQSRKNFPGVSAANASHAVNDFERFVAWKLAP